MLKIGITHYAQSRLASLASFKLGFPIYRQIDLPVIPVNLEDLPVITGKLQTLVFIDHNFGLCGATET